MRSCVEHQAAHASVCIEDRHRIDGMDFELQADRTKSVIPMDDNVSESHADGEADDTYPPKPSLAETLCQGWDGLVSKLASNQIQSPVGTYGVAGHVTHHRHS